VCDRAAVTRDETNTPYSPSVWVVCDIHTSCNVFLIEQQANESVSMTIGKHPDT